MPEASLTAGIPVSVRIDGGIDRPAMEESSSAGLFILAQDVAGLELHMTSWPEDIREHAMMLAADALHH